jgi:hypothetical protein
MRYREAKFAFHAEKPSSTYFAGAQNVVFVNNEFAKNVLEM